MQKGSENLPQVAKDGSRRGIAKRGKKHRHTILLEEIQAAVERDTGIKNWDPVVQMAVTAARAWNGYPATDEDGNPVIDEATGKQVMVPPDMALATAAAAKVAPYLHQTLKQKELSDDADEQSDPEDKRDAVLARLESMGVPIKRVPQEDE